MRMKHNLQPHDEVIITRRVKCACGSEPPCAFVTIAGDLGTLLSCVEYSGPETFRVSVRIGVRFVQAKYLGLVLPLVDDESELED